MPRTRRCAQSFAQSTRVARGRTRTSPVAPVGAPWAWDARAEPDCAGERSSAPHRLYSTLRVPRRSPRGPYRTGGGRCLRRSRRGRAVLDQLLLRPPRRKGTRRRPWVAPAAPAVSKTSRGRLPLPCRQARLRYRTQQGRWTTSKRDSSASSVSLPGSGRSRVADIPATVYRTLGTVASDHHYYHHDVALQHLPCCQARADRCRGPRNDPTGIPHNVPMAPKV